MSCGIAVVEHRMLCGIALVDAIIYARAMHERQDIECWKILERVITINWNNLAEIMGKYGNY